MRFTSRFSGRNLRNLTLGALASLVIGLGGCSFKVFGLCEDDCISTPDVNNDQSEDSGDVYADGGADYDLQADQGDNKVDVDVKVDTDAHPCEQKPFWPDMDKDGAGDSLAEIVYACEGEQPADHVKNKNDCNDSNPYIYTGAPEICDTFDNGCNGQTDEGLTQTLPCDVLGDTLNGKITYDCVGGKQQPVTECADPDKCSPQEIITKPCSTNSGACKEGLEDYFCAADDTGVFDFKPSGVCVGGILPLSEDLDLDGVCTPTDLNGLDDDCNDVVDDFCMQYVASGIFNMGCNPEKNPGCSTQNKLHSVLLDAYSIDKFEVTNEQYALCVFAGGCTAPADPSSYSHTQYYDGLGFEKFPVINVTWEQAVEFCKWAGKELPTEAQWEKAAKGLGTPTYPWDEPLGCPYSCEPTCELVNFNMCDGDTAEVGSHPKGASPFGVEDMSGNVSEWVADWFAPYAGVYEENPIGPEESPNKVVRSGAWLVPDKKNLAVYERATSKPETSDLWLGLRCAKKE